MGPVQILALLIATLFGTIALVCLFVGFFLLCEQDEQELKRIQARIGEARRQSWWRAYWVIRSESLSFSDIGSHWKIRPMARSLILIGLGSLLVVILASRFA